MVLQDAVPYFGVEPALIRDDGCTEVPWTIDTIRSTSDPARVGRAPVSIVLPEVEHIATGHCLLDHGAMAMHDTLRLACGPRCIVHYVWVGRSHVRCLISWVAVLQYIIEADDILVMCIDALRPTDHYDILQIVQLVEHRAYALVQVRGGYHEARAAVERSVPDSLGTEC